MAALGTGSWLAFFGILSESMSLAPFGAESPVPEPQECTMSKQAPVPKPSPETKKPSGSEAPDASPSSRLVFCAKLGRELPGLAAPPFATDLGQKIYDTISREAWTQWLQHSLMLVNEKGLRLGDPAARVVWMQECEAFLFASGSAPPPGWVPPAGFVRLSTKKS